MPEIKLSKRYKCASDIMPKLLEVGFDFETASDFLNSIADADVVPKSEVEKLRAELAIVYAQNAGAEITKNKLRMELDVCTKFAQEFAKIIEKEALEKEKVKSEVASVIFEEITDFILTCIENDEKVYDKGNDEYYDGRFAGFKIIEDHIDELKKKKFTEGDT